MPTDRPATPGHPVPPERPVPPDRPVSGRPSAEPVVPSPHRRTPARFSWVGVALLGAAAVIAFTVTLGVFLPALGALGETAARNPANLPDRISICARDWTKDSLSRTFTRDEILARSEAEPIVVSTGLLADCPPAVRPATGGMATVVYAQTGEDAYVPYELVGGP